MLPLWTALLVAPLAIPFVPVDLSNGENPNDFFWKDGLGPAGVDEYVTTAVGSGSEVILGGAFHSAGSLAANGVVLWDDTEKTWVPLGEGPDNGLNGVNTYALSLARLGDDVFVGGQFSKAGGVPASNVAVWNRQTNAWNNLGSGVNGPVWAVAADEQDVFVGGTFGKAGQLQTGSVAYWDRETETWNPLGGNMQGWVIGLTCTPDYLYLNGQGLTLDGSYLSGNPVLRWNRTTHVWSVIPGLNAYSWGRELEAFGDGKVLIGASYKVVVWDEATESLTDMNFPFTSGNSGINAVHAVSDQEMYVSDAALWRWNGSTWQQLSPVTWVLDIATLGSTVIAAGLFDSVGNVVASNVARLESGEWSSLGTGNGMADGTIGTPGGAIWALQTDGRGVFAGGAFGVAGDVRASRVAYWDGNEWSPLGGGITDPNLDRTVYALAVRGADVFVGGDFTSVEGVPVNCIARWNKVEGKWHPLGTGLTGSHFGYPYVYDLAVHGTSLYVAGDFTSAGGTPAHSIARWDMVQERWFALGDGDQNGVDGWLGAMAFYNDDLYVGGGFNRIGPLQSNKSHTMARWDSVNETWSYLKNGDQDDVAGDPWMFLQRDGRLYVSGHFQKAGTVMAQNIAVFDIASGVWSPLTGAPISRSSTYIEGMAFHGPDLVVGGRFSRFPNGDPAMGVARWNADEGWRSMGSGISRTWYSTANEPDVNSVAVNGDELYFGGGFDRAGNKVALNFARWQIGHRGPVRGHFEPETAAASPFTLNQNLPNPMTDRTQIAFQTDRPGQVRLRLFDVAGREVDELLNVSLPAGNHMVSWYGTNAAGQRVPPGIYVYRLEGPSGTLSRKLLMVH